MQTITLSGSLRENVGKKNASAYRREGTVPCVVYGGTEQTLFTVSEKDLIKLIFSPNVYLIDLEIGGKSKKVWIKETQFHPVTDRIIHVDFIELLPNKPVKIELPLKIVGNAPGVAKGGAKIVHFRKVRLLATLEHLVDHVVCDISKLDIGDKIRIKDLSANNFTLLEEPNAVVVAIQASRASRKAEEDKKDDKKK